MLIAGWFAGKLAPGLVAPCGTEGVWSAAGRAAADGTRIYLGLRVGQVVCLVLASAFSLLHWKPRTISVGSLSIQFQQIDIGPGLILTVYLIALLMTLGISLTGLADRSRRTSSFASQVCSEIWMYTMAVGDYEVGAVSPGAANLTLYANLKVVKDRQNLRQQLTAMTVEIPQGWGDIRASDLDVRRAEYRERRLRPTMDGLNEIARSYEQWSAGLQIAVVAVQMIGIVVVTSQALGLFGLNIFGVVSSLAAGITALSEARRYAAIAIAARTTANDIADQINVIDTPADNGTWATFVAEVEAQSFTRPIVGI